MSINIKQGLSILAMAGLLVSCEKNLLDDNLPYTLLSENGTAAVKFYHAYASKQPSLTTVGPNMFLYQDGKQLNGAAFTYAISQGTWPAPSTSTTNSLTFYSSVAAGSTSFQAVMARVSSGAPAPAAGDTLLKTTFNLEAGKYYTAVFGDTLPNLSLTLLEDNFAPIPENTFKVRLANFAAWPNDVYDLYSLRENRIILSGVQYKNASEFISLPVPGSPDTLSIIKRSGNSPLADTVGKINGFTGLQLRAYTIFTRGKTTATSTSFQTFSTNVITQW